jgi:hypothetical protein
MSVAFFTGIVNENEYYTNNYFISNFASKVDEWVHNENVANKRPWTVLREAGKSFYTEYEKYKRRTNKNERKEIITRLAEEFLTAFGYENIAHHAATDDEPFWHEVNNQNGSPQLWVLLADTEQDDEISILEGSICQMASSESGDENISSLDIENLITNIFFKIDEPPRWIMVIGISEILLLDRSKWNAKRYLKFDIEEIFRQRDDQTIKAMALLLNKDSLCPQGVDSLLDAIDEDSSKQANEVSQDLKYALRECIELLGNEVIYDKKNRLHEKVYERDEELSSELSIECLRYMYRILFLLFIESRPELEYAPIKAKVYATGYSLESLREVIDDWQQIDNLAVDNGYYLDESLKKLFSIVYDGYPDSVQHGRLFAEKLQYTFRMPPLKAHIFDLERTPNLSKAKLRNSVLIKIINRMSISRPHDSSSRPGRISYAHLGINQLGAVYEALLSYRGFFAEEDLFEVKRSKDKFNELDVGYFVPEKELDKYAENERVRNEDGSLRKHLKGEFIYRLAGREREKSASYYTPESLTKCLVKYALKELLKDKNADDILKLKICEPAMGSAAFLNEAINQLAEAYLEKKQEEHGQMPIRAEERNQKLQEVKMYIADRNVYGIDLNPIAVELAEVSLWLNTISKNSRVPWFGTQLVCGNSLIGARRQVFTTQQLIARGEQGKWFNFEPKRVIFGEKRKNDEIYHFLVGDPGMCNYTDHVIKNLKPDMINYIKNWNKEFTKPYSHDEIVDLLNLSLTIDELWEKVILQRKQLELQTRDEIEIYGQKLEKYPQHTSIREKDEILNKVYRSEQMQNAGPYARLKLAMDYWCSLWFWPISDAKELPSRKEFISNMGLILEGGIVNVNKVIEPTLFGDDIVAKIAKQMTLFKNLNQVNLDELKEIIPRLELVTEIADTQKFLHWELEFADIFADNGGFDLVVGNPPWIKIQWNEESVLADTNPLFFVKKMSASRTAEERNNSLKDTKTYDLYLKEYVEITGQQNFYNANQNYSILKGQQTNLYKCFLPQAWQFNCKNGTAAFIHPEGVYDDPRGGALRQKLYEHLRVHFQFANERKLFGEVDHHTTFSLNVYGGPLSVSFDTLNSLFDTKSIEQCYEHSSFASMPCIKNDNGEWETKGHPDRIIHVTKNELLLFAQFLDGNKFWQQARLPALHCRTMLPIIQCFINQKQKLKNLNNIVSTTEFWHETNDQNKGIIMRQEHFPTELTEMIYSGPHIGVSNPAFKCSRLKCRLNSDYNNIDLTNIPDDYLQRCNYKSSTNISLYTKNISETNWHNKFNDNYAICNRKMLNTTGERTLISAIIPPKTAFINALFGMVFNNIPISTIAGSMSSVPFDFFLKVTGKDNGRFDTLASLPILNSSIFSQEISVRSLLLNCLTKYYGDLWKNEWQDEFKYTCWTKNDKRLNNEAFKKLTPTWKYFYPLRTDYERRQALIEIDVLVAMALGMTLEQLKLIYRIQFFVLNSYEKNTWYDQTGRIVFTINRSLLDVGLDKETWERVKDLRTGTVTKTFIDDTLSGGPVKRTITYVAPFDKCDREKDYESAWTFFAKKYNLNN